MVAIMKAAAGFVIYKKSCDAILYLLLQTSYGEHHWTPPKGHVDPGETEMTTAIRETVEESGLKKGDLKIYEDVKRILNYKVNGKPKVVTYWLAELVNPQAKVKLSEEHQDYKWLNIDEACVYGKYPDLQESLKYFDNYIRSNKLN
jgi:bis(5'-nucleosidyl)-tetraphosphatase